MDVIGSMMQKVCRWLLIQWASTMKTPTQPIIL